MSTELEQFKDKMSKSIDSLANEYTTIRAGRANPHVLDKISVDYYGQPTNLQSVANISVSEARTLVIQPWEANMVKEIEKAILVSDLGLTPNNDGKMIRLTFPELTEDRRKELVKDVKKKGVRVEVTSGNGFTTSKDNGSIMLSIKVTQTMLKILNDLGLREPVMSDVSEDDYL